VKIESLFVYPIKSAAGVRVGEAFVERRGFQLDRTWMVVDEEGMFLTQREHPRLCLVEVAIEADALVVRAPDLPPLSIPVLDSGGPTREVQVWDDVVRAEVVRGEASAWFSRHLGVRCEIVRLCDEEVRAVSPKYARPGDEVSFADGYPVLAIGEASLAALNERLAAHVPMDRFRPNVVLSGCEAFAEDTWTQVALGAVQFRAPRACDRCVIVNTDQRTTERSKEPLATLAKFRRTERGGVPFGRYLIPDTTGKVRVGDEVMVT
jgi:uncharacterized protein YcbX